MKLDKIKFGMLVNWIGRRGLQLDAVDILDLDNIIDIEAPEAPAINVEQLHALMALMAEGQRKIEAIKQHRSMTGYGLRESKDIVEKYWPEKGYTKQQMLTKSALKPLTIEEANIIEKFINEEFS